MLTNDSSVVVSLEKDNASPPSEPFYVVLVDIKQTIDTGRIQCIKESLESGADLKYVAISYRWGELPEQIVPTVDYNAHVTSFHVDDFVKLCELISYDPELGEMQYVWVDAICVDQMNEARKKETIYRMNDIYDQANYILAVPDLHLAYLKKNPRNLETIESMQKNALLIYHILQRNKTKLQALDDEMLEWWEVPEENRADMARYVAECELNDAPYDYLREPLGITPAHYAAFQEKFSTWPNDTIVSDIFETEDGYYGEKKEDLGSVFSTQPAKTSSHQVRAKQSNFAAEGEGRDKAQYFYQQTVIMMQVNKWTALFKERDMMIRNALEFFKYLISDWSNRVWVISEYHISKKKQKLMLWFLSFSERKENTFESDPFIQVRFPSSGGNPSSEEEDEDGDDDDDNEGDEEPKEKSKRFYASTQRMIEQGISFFNHVKSALTDRRFLELMLESNASRNEDRFNAVLPISAAHRPYLEDQDTISQWKISDMVSVRMRVRHWLTAKENIILLYSMWRHDSQQILLPSFDREDIDSALNDMWKHFGQDDLFEGPAEMYNFDLQQLANESSSTCSSVFIVDENDTTASPSLLRYSIHVQPRQYQVQRIYYPKTVPYDSYINAATWKALQLDPFHDALVYVQIRLLHSDYSDREEMMEGHLGIHHIALVGSMEKNRWVTVGYSYNPKPTFFIPPNRRDSHFTRGELILHENTEGLRFHIY